MDEFASTYFASDLGEGIPKYHPPIDERSWAIARFEKRIVVKASKALENRSA
jgi:hypothetical protein